MTLDGIVGQNEELAAAGSEPLEETLGGRDEHVAGHNYRIHINDVALQSGGRSVSLCLFMLPPLHDPLSLTVALPAP